MGDLRRLPFADGTFSAVLDVLTPANYDEFRRVLSPDGVLLKVYPGQDYLREIRAARGMSAYEEGQVDAYLREKAQLVKAVRVHETLPVSPELWGDFVRMTPLNHDLSAAEKDALAQRADAPCDGGFARCAVQIQIKKRQPSRDLGRAAVLIISASTQRASVQGQHKCQSDTRF